MNDRVVYNSEDGLWYKAGDDPWTIREIPNDRKVQPVPFAAADTYASAFENLFGYPAAMPILVRSPRTATVFA